MSNMKTLYILLLLVPLFSAPTGDAYDDWCVYTLYVKTGTIINGGTDSNISLTLGDSNDGYVFVGNLTSWGLMEPDHDYYEIGGLDVFSGSGPCLDKHICRLHLASDGTGNHHGWYCEYVEVTTTGPHKACYQIRFNVEQWLATDRSPYQLTADIDGCGLFLDRSVKQDMKGKFVVGNRKESSQ